MNERPGIWATIASALLAVPVALEALVHPEWSDAAGGHLFFAVTQLLGWVVLMRLVLHLRHVAPGRRWAAGLVVAGCAFQVIFAIGYAASVLVSGEPNEGFFVAFLVGFLSLTVGGIAWGLRLRREAGRRAAGTGLLVVAGCGFLAMALGMDPLHDLFLLSSYGAWILVGRGIGSIGVPSGPVSHPARSVRAHG